MDKTFANQLLKFPLQEMNNTSEQFRSFAIPFVDKVDNEAVYTELFQYSDLKRKYKINEKEYSFDDQNLDDLIESLFQEISKGEELCNQNQNNFAYLDDLSKKIDSSNFENCRELNSLQRELSSQQNDSYMKLEHFTDWILDYTSEMGLWQQRFPKKLYEIGCINYTFKNEKHNEDILINKIFSFSNMDDPSKENRYIFINDIYNLNVNQSYLDRINFDSAPDDTKVYFLDIKQKDDNPLNDDYFDEWYDLLVLNNNPD